MPDAIGGIIFFASVVTAHLICFGLIAWSDRNNEERESGNLLSDTAQFLMASAFFFVLGFAVILVRVLGFHPILCWHGACGDVNTWYDVMYAEMSLCAGLAFLGMFIWKKLRTIPHHE